MLSLMENAAWFENALSESIASFGPQTPLRDAVEYALLGAGKRFRPRIIQMIAGALEGGGDVKEAALALEFFHTASLIADDLPCMDDAEERRARPALHVAFGESTALLASYALIAAGYGRVSDAFPDTLAIAIVAVTKTLGISGLAGGQFLDLNALDPGEDEVLEMMDRKTGALFELAFVFGWLAGKGDPEALPDVEELACHFGRAFQIADDLDDYEEDLESGRINYAVVVGTEEARERLDQEVGEVSAMLKKLRLRTPELMGLMESLEAAL